MTRAEMIDALIALMPHLPQRQVEQAVKRIFSTMADQLAEGGRIEIRGFGSFALRHRPARQARNPRTGELVMTKPKRAAHFKPGKQLREAVIDSASQYPISHLDFMTDDEA